MSNNDRHAPANVELELARHFIEQRHGACNISNTGVVQLRCTRNSFGRDKKAASGACTK